MIFSPERLVTYHPNEELVTIVREYGITRLPGLAIDMLLYLLSWFFLYPLFALGWWGIVIWLTILVGVVFVSVRRAVTWYGDCCIITNQRIIDIDRRGLFDTQVREVAWEQITDIQFNQRGFWATLLHYGTLHIVTSIHTQPIQWQRVYQPNQLRDILSEYVPTIH